MPTIRENVVLLKSKYIETVRFVEGSAVASKGQPFNKKPIITHDGEIVAIQFNSGRKKTASVANQFNSKSNFAFAPRGGSGGKPQELNFFFAVEVLWVTGDTSTLYLGQGSTKLKRNNWWITSPHLELGHPASLVLPSGMSLTVDGTDIQEDIGDVYDKIKDNIPANYRETAKNLGDALFKELFGAVNVFTFSEDN